MGAVVRNDVRAGDGVVSGGKPDEAECVSRDENPRTRVVLDRVVDDIGGGKRPERDPVPRSAVYRIALDQRGRAAAHIDGDSASGNRQPSDRDASGSSNLEGVHSDIGAVDRAVAASI